jgi:ABC-2 type transport system ATP-binding protein
MVEIECREPLRALPILRSSPHCSHAALFGRRIHVLVEEAPAAMSALRDLLGSNGIAVTRLEVIPFSLEDLFVIFVEMEEQRRKETHA